MSSEQPSSLRGTRTAGARVALVAGLLIVGAVTGCGGSQNASTPHVYTRGASIAVAKGDTFVIALEANPSTGYSWAAEPNSKVDFVSSKQVTSGTRLGAPGTQRLTFRAVEPGTTTLVLHYERSFEPGLPPLQTERFPVTVSA